MKGYKYVINMNPNNYGYCLWPTVLKGEEIIDAQIEHIKSPDHNNYVGEQIDGIKRVLINRTRVTYGSLEVLSNYDEPL